MGDADDSYDFLEIAELRRRSCARATTWSRAAACRRAAGTVLPGAMPFLHRWFGNPMFSCLARRWFRRSDPRRLLRPARLHAASSTDPLDQRCTGMEFATEMIIKASLQGARIAEVPITLHPDGRRSPRAAPEDFPRRLAHAALLPAVQPALALPGARARLLIVLGLIGYALAMPRTSIWAGRLRRAHAALREPGHHLRLPVDRSSRSSPRPSPSARVSCRPTGGSCACSHVIDLEKGLLAGVVMMLVGLVLLAAAVNQWRLVHFGRSTTPRRCAG